MRQQLQCPRMKEGQFSLSILTEGRLVLLSCKGFVVLPEGANVNVIGFPYENARVNAIMCESMAGSFSIDRSDANI